MSNNLYKFMFCTFVHSFRIQKLYFKIVQFHMIHCIFDEKKDLQIHELIHLQCIVEIFIEKYKILNLSLNV